MHRHTHTYTNWLQWEERIWYRHPNNRIGFPLEEILRQAYSSFLRERTQQVIWVIRQVKYCTRRAGAGAVPPTAAQISHTINIIDQITAIWGMCAERCRWPSQSAGKWLESPVCISKNQPPPHAFIKIGFRWIIIFVVRCIGESRMKSSLLLLNLTQSRHTSHLFLLLKTLLPCKYFNFQWLLSL